MLLQGGAVTPAWSGKAVVCIATGPSLTDAQIELVRVARVADAVRVIVVNDAYLVAPFADVLYYADQKWRGWQVSGIERVWPWRKFAAVEVREAFAAFRGQRCSVSRKTSNGPKLHEDTEYLRILLSDSLSTDRTGLATGTNSGHQALNIAALSGAKLVLLLGYDAGRKGAVKHAFGEHPDKTEPPYSAMLRAMKTTQGPLRQMGVRVVNCTPGSAIECFERGNLEVELEGLLSHSRVPALSA
jgi:hypothetical protein